MQERIRKALKGDQEAALSLYDEHKRTVRNLCSLLLVEEKELDRALVSVFKKVFEELFADHIADEAEFAQMTVRKTVLQCKALASQKNNRAFRAQINANFAATVYDPEKMDITGDMKQIVLKNLPAFQRYVYVLNAACEYSAEQISKVFAMPSRVIKNALNAQQVNVDKIAAIARDKREELAAYTLQDFHSDLLQPTSEAEAAASADDAIKQYVQAACEPIKKAQRKSKIFLISTAGAVAIIIAIMLVLLSTSGGEKQNRGSGNTGTAVTTEESDNEVSDPAEAADAVADSDEAVVASYYADIVIENYGTITVALNAEAAPETVANFVSLAQSGFYDGLTFHRIINSFMMQGGDPDGDGTGGNRDADGNKITITGEFSANGFDNPLSHTAGAISMARASDYNSASSQFFIVHTSDYIASLDGQYACFGYVTEGMDIVDAVCAAADPNAENGMLEAEDQPVITSISIREVEQTKASEDTTDSDIAE